MMECTVNGKTYLVQFRYRTRRGNHAGLYGGALINGVTVCVICGQDRKGRPFVAIGTAVCTLMDQWVQRAGRGVPLENAVRGCGLLRDDAEGLLSWYSERFPAIAPKRKVKGPGLTDEQREARIQAGAPKREKRAALRAGDSQTAGSGGAK